MVFAVACQAERGAFHLRGGGIQTLNTGGNRCHDLLAVKLQHRITGATVVMQQQSSKACDLQNDDTQQNAVFDIHVLRLDTHLRVC